jgi:hypothetical protein
MYRFKTRSWLFTKLFFDACPAHNKKPRSEKPRGPLICKQRVLKTIINTGSIQA